MVLWTRFIISNYFSQVYDVSGYDKQKYLEGIGISTGFTLQTDPTSGGRHLIQVSQGLDMNHILNHTLANPN